MVTALMLVTACVNPMGPAARRLLPTLGVDVGVEDQIPANYMPGIALMPVTGQAGSGS